MQIVRALLPLYLSPERETPVLAPSPVYRKQTAREERARE